VNLEHASTQQAPLRVLAATFWTWYAEHEGDTWPVRWGFVTVHVSMRKLHGLFEVIFGPNPHKQSTRTTEVQHAQVRD
jgi:hypothetical protein